MGVFCGVAPEREAEITAAFAEHQSVADKAAEEGGKWLDAYIERNKIDRDSLTKADWFLLTRKIPCSIRCWWIGEPVDVKPGEPCPECGKECPLPTAWERLAKDDDL